MQRQRVIFLCFQIGKLQTELANCQAELEIAKRGGSVQELLGKKQESLSMAIHEIDSLKIQVNVAVLGKILYNQIMGARFP
jgi:hypothetical protein